MRHRYYILLDDHSVVGCDDLATWAFWFEDFDRQVADTQTDNWRVSTVFLGIDHGWGGVPLLFETMVFGGPRNDFQMRYGTWDQAVAGHAEEVARTIQAVREVNAIAVDSGAESK